jgi:hypothetical protein
MRFRLIKPKKPENRPEPIRHSADEAIKIAMMYDNATKGNERNRQEHRVRFFEFCREIVRREFPNKVGSWKYDMEEGRILFTEDSSN